MKDTCSVDLDSYLPFIIKAFVSMVGSGAKVPVKILIQGHLTLRKNVHSKFGDAHVIPAAV